MLNHGLLTFTPEVADVAKQNAFLTYFTSVLNSSFYAEMSCDLWLEQLEEQVDEVSTAKPQHGTVQDGGHKQANQGYQNYADIQAQNYTNKVKANVDASSQTIISTTKATVTSTAASSSSHSTNININLPVIHLHIGRYFRQPYTSSDAIVRCPPNNMYAQIMNPAPQPCNASRYSANHKSNLKKSSSKMNVKSYHGVGQDINNQTTKTDGDKEMDEITKHEKSSSPSSSSSKAKAKAKAKSHSNCPVRLVLTVPHTCGPSDMQTYFRACSKLFRTLKERKRGVIVDGQFI
jgi:hypothetical protein